MATIQELLANKNYEDILNKFKNSSQKDENADLRSKVQSDVDQFEPEEAVDALKQLPRSKDIIPSEKVGKNIEMGKVKSFVPEDLNNPSNSLNKPDDISPAVEKMPAPPSADMTPENMAPMEDVMPHLDPLKIGPGMNNTGGSLKTGLLASIPLMTGEAVKNAYHTMQNEDQRVKSGEFSTSPEDLTKIGNAGMHKPSGEMPPIVTPPNLTEPSAPQQQAGIPWNLPAGLMNNKVAADQAPDAAPDSPEKDLINQQTGGSHAENLLNNYRSLASEQNTGLRDAQDSANKNEMFANILKGVNQFNAGVTGSNITGPAKVDNNGSDSLLKSAQNPVTQYKQQVEDQKHDPSSRYSQIMRDYLGPKMIASKERELGRKLTPEEYKEFNDNFKDTSGDVAEKIAPHLATELATQAKLDYNKILKNAAINDKESQHQNQALQQVSQLVESARGNPAAAQAEKDIYAASKAKSLATLYGNPDNLNPAMTQLLSSEVAKIAAGNAPTMHELEGLTPSTLHSKFAGVWEKLANHPSKANAGAFIKQYIDYSNALTKDAEKVIKDKYGRIIETNKDRVGPEGYKHLQENYMNRFKPEESSDSEKTVSNKPDVMQNGHLYKWNNATGKYE